MEQKNQWDIVLINKVFIPSKLDEKYAALQKKNLDLESQLKQYKSYAEGFNEKKIQVEELYKQINELTTKLVELEPQYMIKAYNRQAELDEEIRNSMLEQMPLWQKAAIKIQAMWKGRKARSKYSKLIEMQANSLKKSKTSSDHQVLLNISKIIKKSKLTLEECYRAADSDSDGIVSCEEFLRFLSKLKLNIDPNDLNRMISILDEDLSGKLEHQEFYEVLAAYRVISDTSKVKGYSKQVLNKLVETLQSRDIQPEALFRSCDADDDGNISTQELFNLTLTLGLKKREVVALMDILDSDGTQSISKEEFFKRFDKENPVFVVETLPSTFAVQTKPADALPKSIQTIIENIEASGTTLSKAFDMINFPPSGKIQISYICDSFSKLFNSTSPEDVKALLSGIDSTKTGYIHYKDLVSFLHAHCDPSTFTLAQTISHIEDLITKSKCTIKDLLETKGYPTILDINNFIKWTNECFSINQDHSMQLFNQLSTNYGKVTLQDLENKFNQIIQTNVNSPRTLATNTIKEILKTLERYSLKTSNVFKCADKNNTGSVSSEDFIACLKKLIPSMSDSLLKDFFELLPTNLTLKDLEVLVPQRKNPELDEYGMKEEEVYWVILLKLSMDKLGTTNEVVFRDADKDSNGQIVMEEFKSAIKRCIPGSMLTYTDICMIFKSFDLDSNGYIDLQEFNKIMAQSQKSLFYDKVIERIQTSQKSYNLYSADVIKSREPEKFPIPPLPLSHLPKKKEYDMILKGLSDRIPSNTLTHDYLFQYNMRPTSIITVKHLYKMFHLDSYESLELLNSLDLHNKGVVYCFALITVIDSYRYQMIQFPIPHNPHCDPLVLSVIQKIVRNIKQVPVFYNLPNLQTQINWSKTEHLPLETQDIYALKQSMPKLCYYYHLAAALLNSSIGMVISPEEVIHNALYTNIKAPSVDYFQNFSIHVSDVFEKSQFIDKISNMMDISLVEADAVCNFVYKNKNICPVYVFFTYFDMVYSTYDGDFVSYPMPKLPICDELSLNSPVKLFYKKLCEYMNKPVSRYGLKLTGSYTEKEIFEAVSGIDASQEEVQTYLSLLKMNRNYKIRCYHLISVLHSYKDAGDTSQLGFDLNILYKNLDHKLSGPYMLKAKNYQLDDILNEVQVQSLLPSIDAVSIQSLFNFIDYYSRGFVFGHQIATIIDIGVKVQEFKNFPLSSNPKLPPKIKEIMKDNSKHLDYYNKSAISFYKLNKIAVDESIDLISFSHQFSTELTTNEASLVFNCLDVASEGKIKAYYYISCIESFCRNKSFNFKQIDSSAISAALSISLQIPENVSTINYFSDLVWHKIVTKDQFYKYIQNRFSINTDSISQIYDDIDTNGLGSIFIYQFIAYIDIYRNCIQDGKIIKQPVMLPYRWIEKNTQADLGFHGLSQRLDIMNKGTCDYFWNIGIDPIERISIQELQVILIDMSDTQVSQIFLSLDISHEGRICLYHLLAALETYRSKLIPNSYRPVHSKSSGRQERPLQVTINPLQDALNRLGRYIYGDNPKKRPLVSQEIFGMMDENNDGVISMNEFLDCLNLLPLNLSQNQIYLLLKEADLDRNGIIDYNEFTNFAVNFVKKSENKEGINSFIPKTEVKEVIGIEKIGNFKENSIEDAIGKIKVYAKAKSGSESSIESVFARVDSENALKINKQQFTLALERLNLGLTPKQKEDLLKLSDKDRTGIISYGSFIRFIYNYNFDDLLTPL